MSALPRPMALQNSVRTVTETLAREVARPGSNTPDWSDSDWLLASAAAVIQGISPLLAHSLRWEGPPGWRSFLDEQRRHTQLRHVRIEALLEHLDEAAREAGIALVALKGAALHELQLYCAGERPMADVDLLVSQSNYERAVRMLEGLGFHLILANWKHQVFVTDHRPPTSFGEHAANGMKVELHHRIAEALPVRIADITGCVSPNLGGPGLSYYPSLAALMLHLLLHAGGNMALRAARFLNFVDIARLSDRMDAQDWDEFLALENALDERLWWPYPPLAMTARYYPDVIPERVLTATSSRCHSWLRHSTRRHTVCDVSLCHLWISAFPGIEWMRTPGQMLKYVMRRLVPDTQVRALRKTLATTEAALAESTWAHLSQGRRLLRWLTSRPMRPESIRPFEVALAQPTADTRIC